MKKVIGLVLLIVVLTSTT